MTPTNWNPDYTEAPDEVPVRLLLNTGKSVIATYHRAEYEEHHQISAAGWESEDGLVDESTILGWMPEDVVPPEHAAEALSPVITATIDISAWQRGVVERAIISQAVDRLVARCQYDMTAEARKTVQETIRARADEAFSAFVDKHLMDLFTKGIAPAGFDGTDKGSVPLEETLLAQFQKYLGEKVNANGDTINGYDRDSKYITRAQWMLNKLAHDPLQAAINEGVKEVTERAREMIKSSVSGYITEKLMPTVSVPALGRGN